MDKHRRSFIPGIAGAELGALAYSSYRPILSAFGQTPAVANGRLIDVHHHFVPPFYLSENRDRIAGASGGRMNPAWSNWTPAQAIAAMDEHGVGTAILSLTTPGTWFGDAKSASQTARRVNEYAADLGRSHPGRFGFFAAIPLPDTDSSLHEIDYSLGTLKADGISLLTSYADKWLGDSAYHSVFEELNRRKAVVFVHPTAPLCCRALLPDISAAMIEIPQDTTRAVTNLVFSGTLAKFRDIRFIFTHAGGNVPMVLGRMHQYAPKDYAEKVPDGIENELRCLYYDIAGTAYRPAIAALTSFVPSTQILFGSDHPFVPLADTAERLPNLDLSAGDLQRIGRDNALALLPRLKTN